MERVQSRAGVSRLFSNRETGQVTLVLVWRRRAQERRGRILWWAWDDVEQPKFKAGWRRRFSVNVTRAEPGSYACAGWLDNTAAINEQ